MTLLPRRALRAGAGTLTLALLLTGCPSKGKPSPTPPTVTPSGSTTARPEFSLADLYAERAVAPPGRRGGTARIAVEGAVGTLDTFAPGGDTPAARDLAPLWLPGLYRREAAGKRSPWLATGPPRPTADGRRVVIDLRADARWSDGTPITSADVAATWRYASERPGPWRTAYRTLAGVETPTPQRAVLVLRNPSLTWTTLFTAPTGVLPAARIATQPPTQSYDLAVTGGPFRLAGRETGLVTRWRRTPHPWPGSDPLLDGVDATVVTDFTTAARLVAGGQLDGLATYAAVGAEERMRRNGVTPVPGERTGASIVVLSMATDRAPLNDRRVRQAIAAALDRSVFGSRLLRADGATAHDLVPSGRPGHRAPFARWRGDLAAAKRLLGDAGWREQSGGRPRRKSGAELTLVLAVPSPSDVNDIVVRGIQVQLRALGVQLDLATAYADQAAELARARQADLSIARWDTDIVADLGRLFASTAVAPAGAGTARWKDGETDRRLNVLSLVATPGQLDAPAAAVVDRLADQVPVLPLYSVHPVLGAGKMTLPAPLSGYGGPFAAVDRWAMTG